MCHEFCLGSIIEIKHLWIGRLIMKNSNKDLHPHSGMTMMKDLDKCPLPASKSMCTNGTMYENMHNVIFSENIEDTYWGPLLWSKPEF